MTNPLDSFSIFRSAAKFCVGLTLIISLASGIGCGGAGDLLDLVLDPPDRKQIDVTRMGVNNFFVDRVFGDTPSQYQEIRDTLGLKFIRVLFAWTDPVQPNPSDPAFYGLYDEIISNIPEGVDILIVLAHTPNWMNDPSNWIDGNPRTTWNQRWLEPTVARYRDVPGVIGFEVFNEPNLLIVPSDISLNMVDSADNYFELLSLGSASIRRIAPTKLVLNAATESIQQNFPTHLDYNRRLRDLGAEGLVDVWNVHYFGTRFESVVTQSGVADFLNSLQRPIWITESGETGPNNQLAYVETAWPFLREKIPSIDRIYYYQFGETTTPVSNNFGLRTTDPALPVSDLYVHLRDER